jgi:hypothetical protein
MCPIGQPLNMSVVATVCRSTCAVTVFLEARQPGKPPLDLFSGGMPAPEDYDADEAPMAGIAVNTIVT